MSHSQLTVFGLLFLASGFGAYALGLHRGARLALRILREEMQKRTQEKGDDRGG